ncbi:unnamed protein product [Nyctereutes procyonoides]|uniref:(raccoon dog) hypothetical protein n=1 Tax=Nyctereutes procyonoides TaxID=34880 RepID=A0A811ZPE1_NYCPR|nr:unnamed protein product [Nyctereutes procyonoides]
METICHVTGGMKVKADPDESSPYAAMLAAQDVTKEMEQDPWTWVLVALRALACSGVKIWWIEDVSHIPSNSTRRKRGLLQSLSMNRSPQVIVFY